MYTHTLTHICRIYLAFKRKADVKSVENNNKNKHNHNHNKDDDVRHH